MNVNDPAYTLKWKPQWSKKARKEQAQFQKERDLETMGVHREQLSHLSRGHYNMDLLAKIVSVKIDVFELWCEIPGFQIFLKKILHIKEGTPSSTTLLRTQEWAMNLAYQEAARCSQQEEDVSETSEEPEEDDSASIVESNGAGEDGPHFEGDDLIAFWAFISFGVGDLGSLLGVGTVFFGQGYEAEHGVAKAMRLDMEFIIPVTFLYHAWVWVVIIVGLGSSRYHVMI